MLEDPAEHARNIGVFVGMEPRCVVGMERAKPVIAPRTTATPTGCGRGTVRSFELAWLTDRQGLFYPYSAWATTIGCAFYQPKMQPDERSLAILQRTSAAIHDIDSFGALGL